jgi:hypothetical protein
MVIAFKKFITKGGVEMPQNIFKIYDGRTNFWQWDRKQKLIVLDETITQVHFSNRNMTHSVKRDVYIDKDGLRVCNVPDDLLKIPRNLVAYAYANGATVKSVKFAVVHRPMPSDYVSDQSEELYEIERRLALLEIMLKDIELGNQKMQKFDTVAEAAKWAQENQASGIIVAVRIDGKWIAHMVEDDYSITPICNCDGEMVVVNLVDGGDGDGYDEDEEIFQIWDGGSAAGI